MKAISIRIITVCISICYLKRSYRALFLMVHALLCFPKKDFTFCGGNNDVPLSVNGAPYSSSFVRGFCPYGYVLQVELFVCPTQQLHDMIIVGDEEYCPGKLFGVWLLTKLWIIHVTDSLVF